MLLLDEPADLGQCPLAGLVRAAEDEVDGVAGDRRVSHAVGRLRAPQLRPSVEQGQLGSGDELLVDGRE